MRCFVTGVGGFIGSHIAEELLKLNHEVIGIDSFFTGKVQNVPEGVYLITGDITYDDLIEMKKCDYVFHTAALAGIQPAIKDPLTHQDNNVTGTLNLLEKCSKYKRVRKVIFSSSGTAAHPYNHYSLGKKHCEDLFKLYNYLYHVDFVTLRYQNVYGERQLLKGPYSKVIGNFITKMRNNESLEIRGNGEQYRDFVHVKDVARANIAAMHWDKGIYEIGTGNVTSINQIAEAFGGEIKYIDKLKGEAEKTYAKDLPIHDWKPTIEVLNWIKEWVKNDRAIHSPQQSNRRR